MTSGTKLKPGSAQASAAIWNSTNIPPAKPKNVHLGRVMSMTLIGLAVGWFAWNSRRTYIAMTIFSVAGFVSLNALLFPCFYLKIERVFLWCGKWAAQLITYLLMTILFFGFFWPFGALFRRRKKDRLRRFFEPDADTYWVSSQGPYDRTQQF